ncbi:syndecan-4 [Rousettus aegyptiacus]|uniref:Syndecan n=1 Tax=Rousettus aegyptiacus TaxID=9407 RepID=A0A7J8DKF9_ROUAE|nr:syndecan-4 [Rousettus aegyptiacus]KAF6423697.1 syndecan 4 [Rousettus aegyptiacus]
MAPARLLALLLLLVGAPAAAAESIRETEVIDPQDLLEGGYFSGALPDDEDVAGPGQEPDDLELSGSGDLDDSEDPEVFPKVIQPLVPLHNHIPERAGPGSRVPTEPKELEENEVIPKRLPPPLEGNEDVSNRVSMSSTAQAGNIFERTEVLAALIVGGVVGILFAIFLVLLLMYRMKKKDEGSYDLGKKPIYKKAPTNEFYA